MTKKFANSKPLGLLKSNYSFEAFCDWGIVFSLSALIFVLPASIAILDSFAALVVFFYLSKKIYRLVNDWPSKASGLGFLGKICFIWKGFAPPVNSLNLPLQLLALAFFISVLFSQYPALSLVAYFGKFVKCVFLYFSFIEACSDEKRIWVFLRFFLLSAFITTLSGVMQHYSGKDFLKGHCALGRINSSFFTANGFGAYLLPAIGLVINFLYTSIVRHRSWILVVVLAIFMVLLLCSLCWTYSRSSWIGYLVILFTMFLLAPRKILFVGALFLVFIFIFLPSLTNVRHMYLINDNNGRAAQKINFIPDIRTILEEGGSGRDNYWKKAISIIRSSPVYGTGLNTYSRIIKRDPDPATWWYAHNSYLQIVAETGLLGLTSFLWMLFVLFWHGLNSCKLITDPDLLTLLQGALSGLSGFLVQSFFDNTIFTVQLSVLMWLFFGMIMALTRLPSNVKTK